MQIQLKDNVFDIDMSVLTVEALNEYYNTRLVPVYVEQISWLSAIEGIIEKNDPENEAQAENIKQLEEQKKNVLANTEDLVKKMKLFQKIIAEKSNS